MAELIATVLDELKKATADLHTHIDKQLETRTAHLGDRMTLIDTINTRVGELAEQYTKLVADQERARLLGIGGTIDDPETLLRKASFIKYLRNGFGETSTRSFTPEERRALSSLSDADGGFMVPTEYSPGLLMQAFNAAAIRPLCNPLPTGRDSVSMPSLSKPIVTWGNKGIEISQQDLRAGLEVLIICDVLALTLIHNNTLDDAAADIWAELSGPFADAIAESEDNKFMNGSGVDEPQGILTDKRVLARAKVSGIAGALVDTTHNGIDVMIDAFYSLKKTYRRNARVAFNSGTEATLRKIKNGDGAFLWQPPVQAGAPATFLGAPVVNPEGMDDVGAGKYPIVFGDFGAGYRIRDRQGITITRLVERYAEFNQVGFLVKRRTGGKVVMAEAFAPVKIATS
jgi:HK97 family phage major capsid protein